MVQESLNEIAAGAESKEIQLFLTLLSELQKIDSEFPLQYAICLVEIALNQGISLTTLSDKTDMPLSTVSRIVGALSQNRQKGIPYNLVKSVISPEERRRKELYLTNRGQEIVHRITKILGDQNNLSILKESTPADKGLKTYA